MAMYCRLSLLLGESVIQAVVGWRSIVGVMNNAAYTPSVHYFTSAICASSDDELDDVRQTTMTTCSRHAPEKA